MKSVSSQRSHSSARHRHRLVLVSCVVAFAALVSACAGDAVSDDPVGDDEKAEATDTTVAPEQETPVGETSADSETSESQTTLPYPAYESELYADDANWLCGATTIDACDIDLDVTDVAANGTVSIRRQAPADDPQVDCFYVYPTVTDGDGNASLDGDHQAEIGAVTAQAARYSAVCDVHAPLYRQVTLPERGLRTDDPELVEIAYGDVLDAWKHYINNADADRGVILIGHSHGSGHLLRLLAEEIDPRQDLRSRLVAAHVIGLTVAVAEGADRGDGTLGDLENIAVCGSADDVGCVLSNSSFLNTEPPGPLAFYGTAGDGEQVVCVHPGAPEGGPALLDTVFDARQPAFSDDHLASGDAPEIETTWISLPGLITGECVTDGDHTWFEITVNADTDDPRVDDIAGAALPEFLGLHIVDMSLGLGDLTRLAGTQAESWSAREG